MKLKTLLETGAPVVDIKNMPDYKVENPEEKDVEDAAEEQESNDVIVKKGSEAEKELDDEKKTSSSKSIKDAVANLLGAVQAFIQAI